MDDGRMLRNALIVRHLDRALAYPHGLDDVRPSGWRAGLDIPEAPRRASDQRLDVEGHDVVIVGIVVVDPSHLRRVVVVPAIEFLQRHRVRLLESARQRFDQLVLEVRGAVREGACLGDVLTGELGDRVGLLLPVLTPGKIVEGPGAVGCAPMRHRAFGIVVEGSEEAFDAFLLVEAEAPIQTQVEPALGFRRRCGHGPAVRPEVEVIHLAVRLIAHAAKASSCARREALDYHGFWDEQQNVWRASGFIRKPRPSMPARLPERRSSEPTMDR